MKKYIIISLLLALSNSYIWAQNDRRTLTAYLYPCIPNAEAYYTKIEGMFEKQYPDIDLQIVIDDSTKSSVPKYYDGGLYGSQADVLEIDCIFLDSLIRKNSIMTYPDQNFLKARNDTMNYDGMAYRDGILYVLPHWIHGNFLFYHKDDAAIKNTIYLYELEKVLGIDRKALTTDLSSDLTMGKMYADNLYNNKGDKTQVGIALHQMQPDAEAITNIQHLMHLTDSLFSLSRDSADVRIKGFVEGKFRVHIGNAESSNKILKTIKSQTGIHNLKQQDIAVRDCPLSNNGSHPLGWVTALGIKTGLSEQKQEDAKTLVNFLLSDEGYLNALIPDGNDMPRYLLPAYKKYYQIPTVLEKAPLYRYFLPLVEDMKPLTLPEMNNEILKNAGRKVIEKIINQPGAERK